MRYTLRSKSSGKNLVFVHHFTKQTNVSLEFHLFDFLVKNNITGAIALKGVCEDDVYTIPKSLGATPSKMVANVQEMTSINGSHKHLGHPPLKILQYLIHNFSLHIFATESSSVCSSCSIIKAHQQPFRPTSFQSHAHLKLFTLMSWDLLSILGLMVLVTI